MTRLLPILVLCLATSTAAADGFYVTESFGGTRIKDELADHLDGAIHVRVSAGYRTKDWAFEGVLTGHLGFVDELASPNCNPEYCYAARSVTPPPPSSTSSSPGGALVTYGVEVKRLARVNKYLELYVGGGLGRGVTSGDYAGNGLGVRAGAQLKGKVPAVGFLFWPLFFTNWGPKVTAAVFVDNGVDFYRLHERYGNRSIDAQLHHLSLGFAVGSDF
ncbi:MAG: hypothetical protein SFX73_08210 [Kofleriaceae bacterium]|nr:hypothetical protein [Kofleriaceae bacterium]